MDEIERMKRFGLAVSRRREELDLSLDEISKPFGVTKQAVSQIETCKNKDVKGSTLFGLMKALKWTPEQLYIAWNGGDPSNIPKSESHSEKTELDHLLEAMKLMLPNPEDRRKVLEKSLEE